MHRWNQRFVLVEIIYMTSPLWRIGKVHLEARLWRLWSECSYTLPSEACCCGPCRCHPELSEMNFRSGKKVKSSVPLLTVLLRLCLTWKCGSNPFSELLFSLQQSSKNLVSFDFSPWQANDTFGAKAWKRGLLGEGEGTCFGTHKQLQVQKMCTRKGRSGRSLF